MRIKHIHEDAASYALGALDARESQEIEAHCAYCGPCDQLAQDAQQIAHRLGFLADPVAPPPGLKQRLMVRLSRDELAPRPSASFRRLRLVSAALAAMFVISMIYTIRMSSAHSAMSEQLEALRSERQQEHDFLTQQGTTMRKLSIPLQSVAAANQTGIMYMRPAEGSAMLVVDRMPQLPAGQVYQLWFAAETATVPMGTFSVDEAGHKVVMLSTALAPYTKFMITVEPAGGAARPGPVVLECDL
jgi:anti-sigma-K factor RskA